MEDCVWNSLDDILAKYPEICQCETCKLDIVALALNQLTPHYIVREQGELYSRIKNLDTQYQIDVCMAITKAVELVKNSPRHASNDN